MTTVPQELKHAEFFGIDALRPSPENDLIYRPPSSEDADLWGLVDSVRERGILEPLVVTEDHFIVSGHRRHAAARLAGLDEVPVRMMPGVRRGSMSPSEYLRLLREHNRQRNKDFSETVREAAVSVDAGDALESLLAERVGPRVSSDAVMVSMRGDVKPRAKINRNLKGEFLAAVVKVLDDLDQYLPVSLRTIHYRLLNAPPVVNTNSGKVYENSTACSDMLSRLLTQARLEGDIPLWKIVDETRPVETWGLHGSLSEYISGEFKVFLDGYRPDFQRGQRAHIEIVTEKNTTLGTIGPVARRYGIPLTSGRGQCSLPPRADIAKRFWASGKDEMVVLFLGDLDPAGTAIIDSFARSMRDDFGIEAISPVWVALRPDQIKKHNIPANMPAKKTDKNYPRFLETYGPWAYELEALSPEHLAAALEEAFLSVLDVERYNAAVEAASDDLRRLEALKRAALPVLQKCAAVEMTEEM